MFNNITLALTAILMLALVAWMAPGILRMNRGRILQNIAIWLAIFAALGLVYQYFGPGSKTPLFADPGNVQQQDAPSPGAVKDTGKQGFTPPKEE